MIVSAVATTARGEVGVVTSAGRVVKLGVLDLPTLPSTANHPNLQGGAPVGEFLTLEGERVLALTSFDPDSPGLALGTRQGVVKRVNPEYLSARDDWDVISLKDGDEVVGAVELRTGEEALCFVTSDAQLLHFGAGNVRPQGRSGGGIAGIKLAAGARVVSFTALDAVRVRAGLGVGRGLGPPRHRGRLGEGDPVLGVPRQGPCHGRRALPPVPQGRGRPGLRLGGCRPSPRRSRQRRTRRPSRAGEPARRVGPARQPAARRLRGPGERVPARVCRGRRGRLTPCFPGPTLPAAAWSPCSAYSSPPLCSCPAAAAATKAKDEPKGKSPTEAMTQAKKLFDDASSVHIDLSTDATPPAGSNGVLGASGDINHDPAFKGDVKVVLGGITANVPVTSVGGKVYAKMPCRPRYITINPAEYGAPDPADFADPDKGLSGAADPARRAEEGQGDALGRPDPDQLHRHPAGRRGQGDHPERQRQGDLRDRGRRRREGLRHARSRSPGVFFSDDKDVTYDVKFSEYGKGVKITAPSA